MNLTGTKEKKRKCGMDSKASRENISLLKCAKKKSKNGGLADRKWCIQIK